MAIRVVLVGLGPIGAAVARQLDVRKGFQLVGAVDIDPAKIGRDAGEVLELGRRLRVRVADRIGETLRATKADVAVLCTSSELTRVLPQLEEVLKRRVPIVTTTEEAAYPVPKNRRLVRRLDEAARKAKVAVIGTGVNPGFVMDALPIATDGGVRARRSHRGAAGAGRTHAAAAVPAQDWRGADAGRVSARRRAGHAAPRGFLAIDSDDRGRG